MVVTLFNCDWWIITYIAPICPLKLIISEGISELALLLYYLYAYIAAEPY
jgi:hypothetical protein